LRTKGEYDSQPVQLCTTHSGLFLNGFDPQVTPAITDACLSADLSADRQAGVSFSLKS